MKLNTIFNRYKTETDGNISLMFGASFVGALALIGAVFDLVLLNKSKQHAQYLTDAAALAALQFEGTIAEKEAAFADHVRVLSKLSTGEDLSFTSSVNIEEKDGALVMTASVDIEHELVMLQHLGGPSKISISAAAEKGIEDVEIALVLDISSSMSGARITEAKAAAKLFVEQLLDDDSLNERISISLVPFGGTVRVPVELSTLLNTPLAGLGGYSNNWIDGEWNQCFEFDAEDIRDGIKHDGTYRVTPDYWSWNKNNPWCPRSGNELVPLTDDKDTLVDRVDDLTLSDGTGSDQGMAWAVETLNPEWKNNFPGALADTPADLNDKTKKVIVFMSDGAITSQHYVRDQDKIGSPPYNSKRKVRVNFNTSLNAFYGACNRAKADNIDIFTIGFNLTKTKHKTYLENCATTASNYIDARTGDLNDVFRGIASEISPLRVIN